MSENRKNLKSKLPHVGITIFAVMSKLAHDSGALNLSQGFPDFPVSPELIDRVTFYMKKGDNQYAPMTGVQPLRAAVEVHGGIPVFSHLKPPGYSIDWDEVQSLINGKTRMIVVNTPHNPTGSILTDRDMQKLDKLTRGTDILVISDEVYEHIIFDGTPHQSAMLYPGLRERSFVVFSFGKTFHSTGWKMGYCLAPDELMQEFRSVHQFLVYCCNTPIQHALADFLADDANYLGISPMYQAKRDLFLDRLKTSRFKFTPTSGSYFQLLDYSDITDEGDMDFAVRLTEEHKVASIPVSAFYPDALDNRVLRFCFAKREETLEKAAEILCRI